MTTLLAPSQIRALPDRTRVIVTWSGGNGPHLYELRRESYDPGRIVAWSIHENRPYGRRDEYHPVETLLEPDHEERWGEKMLHQVRLPAPT